MSEYMSSGKPTPKGIEEIDNTGTLFDAELESLQESTDRLVDQGRANYHEARAQTGLADVTPMYGAWDLPNPESVSVPLRDHYIDELDLLDIMSKTHMRAALVERQGDIDEVHERYGADVPQVVEGAARKIKNADFLIRSIYHMGELSRAGFDEQEMIDDIVQMKYAYKEKYIGPENKLVRAQRRRFLKKKIKEHTTNVVA